jgi:ribosomal protein S14
LMQTNYTEERIASRAFCFITGRSRGTSRRYTVSRTRVKQFSSVGLLLGIRKSS